MPERGQGRRPGASVPGPKRPRRPFLVGGEACARERGYSTPRRTARRDRGVLIAYGVTDVREIDAFLSLARDASKPGCWHHYEDVLPSWFKVAVGLEESASLIRAYEPQVVPGLLQTEEYIRAITAASFPSENEED
jgi:Domain of unknown function (DUF5753)